MSKSFHNIDPSKEASLEEIQVPKNNEISTKEILNWNKIVINDAFAFKVVFGITGNDNEIEPQTIKEYRYRND